MSRRTHILSFVPDADDALRRLADVIQAPLACRKRVCRAARRCQGGFGPPCFFADRRRFADAVLETMNEHRAYWDEHRAQLEADLRRLERRPAPCPALPGPIGDRAGPPLRFET